MTDKSTEPGRTLRDESPLTGIGVKRPLVPVVLALMVGLAAGAWGLQVPGIWLIAGLAGLLAVLVLLLGRGSVRGLKDQDRDDPDESTDPGRDTHYNS